MKMKKTIAMLLVMILMVSTMVGCKNNGNGKIGTDESKFTTDWEGPLKEGLPRFKIGVGDPQFTDKLGSQMKYALEYLAEAFNVEFVFLETGGTVEEILSKVESGLESGMDGLIMCGGSPAILSACKKAGNIPMVMVMSEPTTEEMAKEMSTYDNFLGAVCEDDYAAGFKAAEALYEAGARNFCLASLTKGVAKMYDLRADAFLDFINSKDDATLLADDYSYGLFGDAVAAFAASYPEMDGLFVAGGGENVYQAILNEGLVGKVKYATVEVTESTGEYFDNGVLKWIAGGQYGTSMIGFAILYNYLIDETRIIPDTAQSLVRPFPELNSKEQYEEYNIYVDGTTPVYTIGEVANMIHYFNENADFEYFKKLSDDFSIDDIVERHKELMEK